jgi:multisubunit Na+/H+ antiporter MnhC subunit
VSLLQVLALLLCSIGFHGLFFYADLAKKTLAWVLFQAGLVVFLLGLAPGGPMLPKVLALLVSVVTLAVGMVLALFCRKFWKQYKTLDSNEIAKRGAK